MCSVGSAVASESGCAVPGTSREFVARSGACGKLKREGLSGKKEEKKKLQRVLSEDILSEKVSNT